YPSARGVREAERLAALEARLPTLLGGGQSLDATDLPDLLRVCTAQKRYVAATRLAATRLGGEAARNEPAAGLCYDAACCAALALRVGTRTGVRSPSRSGRPSPAWPAAGSVPRWPFTAS